MGYSLKIYFLFFCLTASLAASGDLSSDSVFIHRIERLLQAKKGRMYLLVKTHSEINTKGDFIFIPTFSFKESVKKHYYAHHELMDTSWNILNMRYPRLDDIVVCNIDDDYSYYQNVKSPQLKPCYLQVNSTDYCGSYEQLLSILKYSHPSFVFRIAGIDAWFFVQKDHIVAYERKYNNLILHNNALDYITSFFLVDDMWF